MERPIIFAHRGASAYAPENTRAAFQKALDLQAGGIELDVHLTLDDWLVVTHDEKIDRTSNGSGWIKDMTLDELKKMDFGSWFSSDFAGEKIMTLEEVLIFLQGWEGILNIELKSGPIFYEGIEAKVIQLLHQYNMVEHSIISSFNHYSLHTVKELDSKIKIGLLYTAGLFEPWEYAKTLGAEAIHPHYYSIQPPIVKGCKEHGIMMNPYTVDKPEYIRLLTLAGVDGIITNVPDVAMKVVNDTLKGAI